MWGGGMDCVGGSEGWWCGVEWCGLIKLTQETWSKSNNNNIFMNISLFNYNFFSNHKQRTPAETLTEKLI